MAATLFLIGIIGISLVYLTTHSSRISNVGPTGPVGTPAPIFVNSVGPIVASLSFGFGRPALATSTVNYAEVGERIALITLSFAWTHFPSFTSDALTLTLPIPNEGLSGPISFRGLVNDYSGIDLTLTEPSGRGPIILKKGGVEGTYTFNFGLGDGVIEVDITIDNLKPTGSINLQMMIAMF